MTYSISPRGDFEKDKTGFVSMEAIKLMNKTPCNDRYCTFQYRKEHRYRTETRGSCLIQWKNNIFIFGGEDIFAPDDYKYSSKRFFKEAGFNRQISMLEKDSSSQAGI